MKSYSASDNQDHFDVLNVVDISAGGDVDTNCAIVGGIVSLATGRDGIPSDWLWYREALPDILGET